jgi:Eukaryotic aspartyl protease
MITSQQGFGDEQGLIGMTRPRLDSGYNVITASLLTQSKISSGVFALYLADSSEQSKLQVGGFDIAYFKSPGDSVTYVPLLNDGTIFWDVNIKGVRVGATDQLPNGTPSGWKFDGSGPVACMDSGTSMLLVP